MAGRQPIPTALPAFVSIYPADSPRGKDEAAELELGRALREAQAKVPTDEWETWLTANCPEDFRKPYLFSATKWEWLLNKANDAYDTDEELIARCRKSAAAVQAIRVEKGQCRAPETSAERDLLGRYLDMQVYQWAVRTRLGGWYARGRAENADPPRMRALAKRLRKRGLLSAPVRYIKREKVEEPKPSRADRAWEKAKRYWAAEIDQHGEEIARHMWTVNKAARAHSAAHNYLTDAVAQQAFTRWKQGGITSTDAVLSVTKGTGRARVS
jgi:hypothetical protein